MTFLILISSNLPLVLTVFICLCIMTPVYLVVRARFHMTYLFAFFDSRKNLNSKRKWTDSICDIAAICARFILLCNDQFITYTFHRESTYKMWIVEVPKSLAPPRFQPKLLPVPFRYILLGISQIWKSAWPIIHTRFNTRWSNWCDVRVLVERRVIVI